MADSTTYLHPTARRAAQGPHDELLPGAMVSPTNVGDLERWLSGVGGGILMVKGLQSRSPGGLAMAVLGGMFAWRGMTGHCPIYQTLGISTTDKEHGHGPSSSIPAQQGVRVEKSMTINRPAEELFAFWRHFENLPRVMRHLKSVTTIDDHRSHWVAEGPFGNDVEWDAEIYNIRPNELIAWRSLDGSQVDTAGSVHFVPAPGNRGTEVHVVLKYNPPAGRLGAAVARLFGTDAEQEVQEDLRRFKQAMEAGEIATTEGQPSGRH